MFDRRKWHFSATGDNRHFFFHAGGKPRPRAPNQPAEPRQTKQIQLLLHRRQKRGLPEDVIRSDHGQEQEEKKKEQGKEGRRIPMGCSVSVHMDGQSAKRRGKSFSCWRPGPDWPAEIYLLYSAAAIR